MGDLRQRLKSGEKLFGTMLTLFDNPDIAKILKVSGFDLFIVDCEHSGYDYSKVAEILSMARAVGIGGFVRVPEAKREVILKYMDMGADGLLLPNCDTVEQAKKLVEYAKYAPLGNRGVSLLRAHGGYEQIPKPAEYMNKANDETILMCQIESPTAVKNIEGILEVEGVDVAFIGPNDLSQSYGLAGQFDHPTVVGAIESVAEAAKKHGKFSGIHMTGPTTSVKKWVEKGMTLNLWSNDVVMMMTNARQGIGELRG